MTTPSWRFRSIELRAFRAYRAPRSFDLSRKRNLAIFAPNACGKSSLTDALELVLAPGDLLGRLGKREQGNDPGPKALAHVGAQAADGPPTVTVALQNGTTSATETLDLSNPSSDQPRCVADLRTDLTVSPVIRGWQLRGFVHEHSPEERHRLVAGWLGLDRLARLQDDLATLRRDLSKTQKDRVEAQRRSIDRDVGDLTRRAVGAWNDDAVLSWVNTTLLPPVAEGLTLAALDRADPAIARLTSLAEAEARTIGLQHLPAQRRAAAAIWTRTAPDAAPEGALPALGAALDALDAARTREQAERAAAATAIFASVWEAAQPLFAEDATAPDTCPVCATPLADTALGSAAAIRAHLARHLADLATYKAARDALERAERTAAERRAELARALQTLGELQGDERPALREEVERLRGSLAASEDPALPDTSALTRQLAALIADLDSQIAQIRARPGAGSAPAAKATLEELLTLAARRRATDRLARELTTLSTALADCAVTIGRAIADEVDTRLDHLREPMNAIYRAIQDDKAVPIRLDPPPEGARETRRLDLLIDFVAGAPALRPAGYLSDSQLHSLALAFRLAAIEHLNPRVPILVLDDIVTSYDADHRLAIATLIADRFAAHQIIVVTHDGFYRLLKDRLPQQGWRFTRLHRPDGQDPVPTDERADDDEIESALREGRSAANLIRKAQDEWLERICREFDVWVRIPPAEQPHRLDRDSMLTALSRFLTETELTPPTVPGMAKPYLESLRAAVIENLGSHHSGSPHAVTSVGDDRRRWDELKAYRDAFVCHECGKRRFKRPSGMNRPACQACETPFSFAGPTAAASP